jgi:hypothetical protein
MPDEHSFASIALNAIELLGLELGAAMLAERKCWPQGFEFFDHLGCVSSCQVVSPLEGDL